MKADTASLVIAAEAEPVDLARLGVVAVVGPDFAAAAVLARAAQERAALEHDVCVGAAAGPPLLFFGHVLVFGPRPPLVGVVALAAVPLPSSIAGFATFGANFHRRMLSEKQWES